MLEVVVDLQRKELFAAFCVNRDIVKTNLELPARGEQPLFVIDLGHTYCGILTRFRSDFSDQRGRRTTDVDTCTKPGRH